MSVITLQQLTIEHFKGCRRFTFAPMGRDCTIAGDNATGKTTVYDALVWCLFGKDSLGRKDFDIKPLGRDGRVLDHGAITSVEARLQSDGRPISLRRTYYEKWATRRGRSQAEFDGHGSDYYVDEVPVTKRAYEAAVAAMVDESTFRVLTAVSFFPEQLHWQDRRAMLFELAGIRTDEEIMETDPQFLPLLTAKQGKPVEDYKKQLWAQRKGHLGIKSDIPARMDEQQKTVSELEELDFPALRENRQRLAEQETALMEQLALLRSQDPAAGFRAKVETLTAQLSAVEAGNKAYRAAQETDTSGRDALLRELEILTMQEDQARRDIALMQQDETAYQEELNRLRAKWELVDTRAFDGSDTCPTCGQSLPKQLLAESRRAFEAAKEQELKAIIDRGTVLDTRLEQLGTRLEDRKTVLETCQKALTDRRERLAKLPQPQPIEDAPEYRAQLTALRQQIEDTEAGIAAAKAPSEEKAAALEARRSALRQDMARLDGLLAQEARLDAARQRMEDLRQQAVAASKALEELDAMISLCEDFGRYKAHFVEDGINGMFAHAEFRLFQDQVNGGMTECCDVVYHGVPYQSLNSGGRINIGIDIIRTISQKTGVSVPLFVDNAEAVTELWDSGSQQIRLVVDETAKELTIR